jgi:hypothetical protein
MPSIDVQRVSLEPSQTKAQTNVVFAGTGGAVRLFTNSPDRRYLRIENTGLSSIWYGASSNVTVGATGANIGTIATAGSLTMEGYGGELWGVFSGLSHATAHVVKVFEY